MENSYWKKGVCKASRCNILLFSSIYSSFHSRSLCALRILSGLFAFFAFTFKELIRVSHRTAVIYSTFISCVCVFFQLMLLLLFCWFTLSHHPFVCSFVRLSRSDESINTAFYTFYPMIYIYSYTHHSICHTHLN